MTEQTMSGGTDANSVRKVVSVKALPAVAAGLTYSGCYWASRNCMSV